MEKANVLKALECCSNGTSECTDCPYDGTSMCASKLAAEALSLLKASEATKTTKYTQVIIFTKRTNLTAYFEGKGCSGISSELYKRQSEYYAKERDVQLIASFRWENRKLMCRIKCPINPVPVKGEFEVPSYGALANFLKANGWDFKQKLYANMFM